MPKPRYFALVSHCLLNPATRVHILGRRFIVAELVSQYLLSHNISMIQLPCPEFTAMGYWRNPQGRMQYDNIFFRKHCKKELESYVDMILELVKNDNTPYCYIGVQGSPTCSIYWGKHKQNKYKTESMIPDNNALEHPSIYGVMTQVLDEMLQSYNIEMPYLEAPVKASIDGEEVERFMSQLDDLLGIPKAYRNHLYLEELKQRYSKKTPS